jgi:hypothetical protein
MTPTNEQIIAEAKRRADFRKWTGAPIEYFIIEVVRENWTPPEPPVDPDVLEFRAWGERRFGADTALAYRLGDCDDIDLAEAYLAGARMAREREQERAIPLVWYALARRYLDPQADSVITKYQETAR